MVGRGWLWVVVVKSWLVGLATKICLVVGTGCEFMPGRGWSHVLVILQALVFPL